MLGLPKFRGETRRETGLSDRQPKGERIAHAFGLVKQYWRSDDWKFAWFALAILLILQFGGAYVFVLANRWQQPFFDSVEQRDVARFSSLIFVFAGILAMQVGRSIVETFVGETLSIRWRTFLTTRYLDRWLGNDRFAEIERLRMIDNPDQRIADDIAQVTGSSGMLMIAISFVGTLAGAVSFAFILLETAEPIVFSIAGRTLSIPGSTVWYAVIYALLGSYLMVKIGQPYIRARMRQQHVEADFRANLIHVRRNAGQIGFAGAVPTEKASLRRTFGEVRRNFRSVIYSLIGIQTGQGIYDRIGTMLPLFLLVPRYFANAISFGQLMGARDAFQTLVGQLSYFIQAYSLIGTQVAAVNRIKGLDDAIDHARPRGIAFSLGTAADVAIAVGGLHLVRPAGGPLFDIQAWQVRKGERWVVQGPSGAGKSTLLRALAGLWPDGKGSVSMTDEGVVMFVPQRLYLPLGTLKTAICFPDRPEDHDDAAIEALLRRVRLGEHADDIHALRIWQEALSPGEQQRIALARILLHQPTLLVLDEATGALDPGNARYFHERLLAELPGITLVSVVHDDRLLRYHTHRMTIEDGHGTPSPIPEGTA